MPRPRKPSHLHLVAGTYRKHRHADRAGEPEVIEPLGGPPESWPVKGKLLWAELENTMPHGVTTKADRIAFELLCRLVAELREGPDNFSPALATQVRLTCGEFSMTPASRSKVCAVRAPEENPFAKL